MQERDDSELALTDEELRLGFSVQTLTYPDGGYELAGLASAGPARLDRTVALAIDDAQRIRRRARGDGYVLERREGEVWCVAAGFAGLAEVVEFDGYRRRVAAAEASELSGDAE